VAPDVILAHGASTVGPLLQATVPVVFPVVSDPVAAGFVESLARPGGNATGFMVYEYSVAGKWLELLKETSPSVTRAAVLRDATLRNQPVCCHPGRCTVAQDGGQPGRHARGRRGRARRRSLRTRFEWRPHRDSGARAQLHRHLIITLAARHKLPAVYYERFFVAAGGLISYGPDYLDQYRQAASYVDRILKGEKPADLPVQAPTKYELVINQKTAKAMGLEIPPTLLARADEVIE
jgi:putative ABC transport system substrate-binding protein